MTLTPENLATIGKLGRILFRNVTIKNANVTIDEDGYLCIDGLAIAICEKHLSKPWSEKISRTVAIHYFAIAEKSIAVDELADGSWRIRRLKSGRGNADRIAAKCKLSQIGALIAVAVYCKEASVPAARLFQQITSIGEEISVVTKGVAKRKMTIRKQVGCFKVIISSTMTPIITECCVLPTSLPKLAELEQAL